MKEYTFSELEIGVEESFEVTITEDMMKSFLGITGDCNPLHNDEEFAKQMGHENRVCYGMLTASMLSTLAGVYLPGRYSLIQSVETKFLKPVFIGDTLIVKGVVKELHESVEQMEMKVLITRKNTGDKVLKGLMKIGFLHERQ